MAMYPEVQKKAQAELDRMVGPTRLPEFNDLDKMPYIQAVRLETLRWLPLVPFSIPHATSESDVYEGYYIPKGALVIPVSIYGLYRVRHVDLFIAEYLVGVSERINVS